MDGGYNPYMMSEEQGVSEFGQTWTRGGRGSKIPKILRTSYVHDPLELSANVL